MSRWPARSLVLALLLCSATTALPAQLLRDYHHTSWGERDGLPRTGLGYVLATPDGYLWIGSASGIIRFDGIRFSRFDPLTTPALASSAPGITDPELIDHAGTLWLTRSDNAVVTWRNDTFTVVVPPDTSRRITHLSEDGRGRIWGVIAGGALQVIDHGALRPVPLPSNVPTRGLLGLVRDSGTGIWIGTRSAGLWHVTEGGAAEIPHRSEAFVDGINPLLQTRDGALWAWGNGLEVLRNGTWSRIRLPGITAPIQAPMVSEGEDGSVWIATRGFGLLRWRNGNVEQFSKENGLSETTLLSVALGTRGVVWLSTASGVDRLRPAPFTTLTRKDGLGFDAPLLLLPDTSGAIWALAAGENAVYLIDGGIVRPGHGPLHAVRLTIHGSTHFLPTAASRSGGLWIHDSTSLVLHYHDGKVEVAGRMIVAGQVERPGRLVEDGEGHTWVSGITHGFGEFVGGRFVPVPLPGVPGDAMVTEMVPDSRGHVWLATRNPGTLQEIVGGAPQLRADSTRGLHVGLTVIAAGSGDTVWGRKGGMLARVIDGHVAMMSIPMVDTAMVGHSPMLALTPDALWVAGEGGISMLPLTALNQLADGRVLPIVPRWFTPEDGVQSARLMAMSWQAGAVGRDGRLWFATPGGLAVADPARLRPSTLAPAVHIEEVRVSSLLVPAQPALVLSPNPDRIEIRYTATGLLVPERARFEYRLDGADTGWVAGGPERLAAYTQLRPGRYRFHLRAWSDDGVPSTSDAVLLFRVLPAWNQSWWFKALLLVLVVGVAGGSVHLFQRMRLRETERHLTMRFDATLAERSRLAGELHDTLLQGFTGVTLQLQGVLQRSRSGAVEDTTELSRVLDLADLSLRDARQMVWDLRAPELEADELPAVVEHAAREEIGGAAIVLRFTSTGTAYKLSPVAETAVLRVAREAVMNAVKHAAPAEIEMVLAWTPSGASLSVRDDGRGLADGAERDATHRGHWGVFGMRERATRAGGTLAIASSPGVGTTVTLAIPRNTESIAE